MKHHHCSQTGCDSASCCDVDSTSPHGRLRGRERGRGFSTDIKLSPEALVGLESRTTCHVLLSSLNHMTGLSFALVLIWFNYDAWARSPPNASLSVSLVSLKTSILRSDPRPPFVIFE